MSAARISRALLVALLAITILAACGEDEVSLDPPEITYGEDISEMGMFVVDPRYTVATLPDGEEEWLLFDDIGELFKYRDTHPGAEFQVIWVNDYYTEEWLKAEDAWYVESPGVNSPMGWGISAFENEDEAMAHHEEQSGEKMTWEEADARTWTAPPAPVVHNTHGATPAAADHGGHGATPAASPDGHSVPATPDHEGH
jgi:copper chaperone NosL